MKYTNHSSSAVKDQKNAYAQLKVDMLETLHYIIGEIHKAAALCKCLYIEGIWFKLGNQIRVCTWKMMIRNSTIHQGAVLATKKIRKRQLMD